MSDISQYSTTAANNNSASPNGFPENMAPSGLNDSAREVMRAIAAWYKDLGGNGTIVSGGTANAQTLTTTQTHAALDDMGLTVFRAGATNSSSMTMAVDGLTAKAVKLNGAALSGGEITSGNVYIIAYNSNGDNYDLLGNVQSGEFGSININTTGTLASGALTVTSGTISTGDLTMAAGDIIYGHTGFDIKAGTSDNSDNSQLALSGGGAASATRGGSVLIYGNEHANTGQVLIQSGNVSGGDIVVAPKGVTAVTIDENGNTDFSAGDVSISGGFLNLGTLSTLTLSSGAVTVTKTRHRIAAETGTTDDLTDLNGATNGDIIIIEPDTGDTITVKDGTGNLRLAGDFAMDSTQDKLILIFNGSQWEEISRSDNSP